MKTLSTLLAVAVLGAATPATADEMDGGHYEPLGKFGQFGIGFVAQASEPSMSAPTRTTTSDDLAFDGTLRFGKIWRATDLVRPGGFFELRTVDFDTFEVAVGPQVQFKINHDTGVQLRAGVGVVMEDQTYALAGIQAGNAFLAGSVTARRDFDDKEVTVSANLEVTALVALLPVYFVALLAGGGGVSR